jgi:hypothetical protein
MTGEAPIEPALVQGRRLGRRPADPRRPLLRLADVLTGTVPSHGLTADHFGKVGDWGLYTNDQYGVCGPTSVANSRKLVTRYLAGVEQSPTLSDVYDLYRRAGNPNFDPQTGTDDNGVDMPTMLSAVLDGGIAGTKGVAYAAVDTSNLDEVRAAIDIFGFLLLGCDLETAQNAQTDRGLWDYRRSGDWGGHAVLAGAYTSARHGADISVITWARVVGTTDSFWSHGQVPEAYVLIWPEHLGTQAFQEGIDMDALARDYQALTGRPFLDVTPTPAPTPVPAPADDPAARLVASVLAAVDEYRAS